MIVSRPSPLPAILVGDRCLPETCDRCVIRNSSLCAGLSPAELSALSTVSRHVTHPAGQTIVIEGDHDVLGNVVSGIIVEKKGLADGREQIVSLLFPGDFIGSGFDGTADVTVETVSPARVCTFDRAGFTRTLALFPGLRQAVLERANAELKSAREWMLLLGQKTAGERIATFLLRLSARQAEAGCVARLHGDTIEIPISRAQTASYLGLTIETVSRKLGALRDGGAIELVDARTVHVRDANRLRAAAGRS